MKVAIMQPYLFPYIGYFQLVNAVDKFVVYDDVSYIKQGWINRNRILINKQPSFFTVPLMDASSFKSIRETRINTMHYLMWLRKFYLTIEHSYKTAPYYQPILELLHATFDKRHEFISSLALDSIIQTCSYLGINTEIIHTSSVFQNSDLRGEERVIAICNKLNAGVYINPIGGTELYSKDSFLAKNISLSFIRPYSVSYQQNVKEYIPWLSIIDVMMFNSVDQSRLLLENYLLE